ncbi:hypothetical protein AB0J20_29125 [Micromonospora costi]|uniref:hypothetical protein n=1 Tax=Micromonospora costi TaxID=1530042 RepID=UPI0033C1CA62
MLLDKVNRNPALAGYVPLTPAEGATAPVMATFTIATPTAGAIAAGAAKALGFIAGAGMVTGAAYVAYEVTNG